MTQIFRKYGLILSLQVRSKQAFIKFDSQISALMAKKALNNYMIEELDVRFLLEFIEDSQVNARVEATQVEERNTAPPGIDPQPSSSAMMFMKTNCKVLVWLLETAGSAAPVFEAHLSIRHSDR